MSDAAYMLLPAERRVLQNARDGRHLLDGWEDGTVFKSEAADAYKAMVAARDLLIRTNMINDRDRLTVRGDQALERAGG